MGAINDAGTVTPTAINISGPVNDPLSALTPPSIPTCLANPNINGGTAQTLGPSTPGGTVCYNGLSINGTGTITLNPGLYIIKGAMAFNSSGTISGAGVTFYFPPGAGSFTDNSGGDTLNLSAPTSGSYNGILFYQDPGDSQAMSLTTNGAWTISGIFYLPAAQLSISAGLSSSNSNVSLVVGSLALTGNAPFTFTPYVSTTLAPPLPTPVLVE